MNAGVLYYTCNTHDPHVLAACRAQLLEACGGLPIGCVSRVPTPFGVWNEVVDAPRGAETLARQILAGLERFREADWLFFAEDDVLYHPSHFAFVPHRADAYYYNINVWKVRLVDGHATRTDFCQQTSGLCAARPLLLEHYRARVARIAREGRFDRRIGFEPGTHRLPRGVDNYGAIARSATCPNLDIRHDHNFTPTKRSPADFRNERFAKGWKETNGPLDGWGLPSEWMARVRAWPLEVPA